MKARFFIAKVRHRNAAARMDNKSIRKLTLIGVKNTSLVKYSAKNKKMKKAQIM